MGPRARGMADEPASGEAFFLARRFAFLQAIFAATFDICLNFA